jgi:hypothetical protein
MRIDVDIDMMWGAVTRRDGGVGTRSVVRTRVSIARAQSMSSLTPTPGVLPKTVYSGRPGTKAMAADVGCGGGARGWEDPRH